MKKLNRFFLLVLMALVPTLAQALSVRPLLGCGAEFGGTKLLTVFYTDGSTSDVFAGQGLSLFGGVALEGLVDLQAMAIDLQTTLGVKYSSISPASNADVNFFRFPAELLVLGHWQGLRFGLGPTYHFANSLSGSGLLSVANFTFDNTLGLVAQIDYTFAKKWNLGIRYTAISYQSTSLGIPKTDASSFGIEAGVFFF